MTSEEVGPRLLARLGTLARLLAHPEVARVWARGGDVRMYLALRQPWLRRMGIRTVVDIGANIGQFAETARLAFPEASLHCFEPLPACFAKLSRRLAGTPGVFLHNMALADTSGMWAMTQNPFSPSSSLREMSATHVREFPWTAGGEQLSVPVSTLDGALADLQFASPLLVKIDVQGTEDLVIAGGRGTLGQAMVVIVETSFESLYKGQQLFDEIYHLMRVDGFAYRGSVGQFTRRQDVG